MASAHLDGLVRVRLHQMGIVGVREHVKRLCTEGGVVDQAQIDGAQGRLEVFCRNGEVANLIVIAAPVQAQHGRVNRCGRFRRLRNAARQQGDERAGQ